MDDTLLEYATYSEANYQVATAIHDIKEQNGDINLEIEWYGLPATNERTLEQVQTIFEDLPGMLEDYISTSWKRQLKNRIRGQYF